MVARLKTLFLLGLALLLAAPALASIPRNLFQSCAGQTVQAPTIPHPEKRIPPSKNRVGVFSETFAFFTTELRLQPVQPHWENLSTPTIIASGRSYTWLADYAVVDLGENLYMTLHRPYHAGYARFQSKDPLGLAGGLNLFAYGEGNPLFYLDYLGLCSTWAKNAGLVVDSAIAKTTFIQALVGRAGRNVDQNQRYIDTEKIGTVDLQHVTSSAIGPPLSSTVGGLLVEINQMIHDKPSAFKTEDIVSNVLGGEAWDNALKRDTSIGVQVEVIINNAIPKGPPYARWD